MYIHPFVAGIISTLLAEWFVFFVIIPAISVITEILKKK